jgi:hypothetical protein
MATCSRYDDSHSLVDALHISADHS